MLNTIIMRHDGYGEKPVQSTMEDMPPIDREVLKYVIKNHMCGVVMEFPGKHRKTCAVGATLRKAMDYNTQNKILYNSSVTVNTSETSNTMITTLDENTWPIFKKYVKTGDTVILYSKDYDLVVAKRDIYRFSYQDIFEVRNIIIYAKHLT